MPATAPLAELSAGLHTASLALKNAPYDAALGDAYVTWMTGVQ
jgi:hypothetical protein